MYCRKRQVENEHRDESRHSNKRAIIMYETCAKHHYN